MDPRPPWPRHRQPVALNQGPAAFRPTGEVAQLESCVAELRQSRVHQEAVQVPFPAMRIKSAKSNFTSAVVGEHPRAAFLKIWPSHHAVSQRLLTRNPIMAGHGDGSCRRAGLRLNLRVQMRGSACSESSSSLCSTRGYRQTDSLYRALPRTEDLPCAVRCSPESTPVSPFWIMEPPDALSAAG